MYVCIDGRWVYLWRAVDAEGEVLDVLVQSKRDKRAAVRLIRKLLRKQGYAPGMVVTDHLRAYSCGARLRSGCCLSSNWKRPHQRRAVEENGSTERRTSFTEHCNSTPALLHKLVEFYDCL
jgi:transposase-like protein